MSGLPTSGLDADSEAEAYADWLSVILDSGSDPPRFVRNLSAVQMAGHKSNPARGLSTL